MAVRDERTNLRKTKNERAIQGPAFFTGLGLFCFAIIVVVVMHILWSVFESLTANNAFTQFGEIIFITGITISVVLLWGGKVKAYINAPLNKPQSKLKLPKRPLKDVFGGK